MTDPLLPGSLSAVKPFTRIVLSAVLVIFFVCVSSFLWYSLYLHTPAPAQSVDSRTVIIPRGSSVKSIGSILAEADLLHEDFRFLLAARFSGYGGRLQAGEFSLPTGKKPLELLQYLATARPVQHPVTVPEGLRIEEIADIFSSGGWCDKTEFVALARDQKFLETLGFEQQQSLEGFLFPDTYHFIKGGSNADIIITRMVKRFSAVWQQLTADRAEKPNLQEAVILASIVEKETGVAQERSHIAGVFHNRLRKGMRLQSDPTVVYGTNKFGLPITRSDLRTPTPYNTYTLSGLPVGPICNPGRAALAAVLNPQPTKNLYFVARNDGTHKFSASLKEHNRAVLKYRRKKTAKKGK